MLYNIGKVLVYRFYPTRIHHAFTTIWFITRVNAIPQNNERGTIATATKPLEIGVRKRDAHSFTIEPTNDCLKKLLKEHKTIRTFDLRSNYNMVRIRISRNVKLKSRKERSPLHTWAWDLCYWESALSGYNDWIWTTWLTSCRYHVKYCNIFGIFVLDVS